MPSKVIPKNLARRRKPERTDATALFKEESKPAWKPDSIESHRVRMDRINLEILKLLSERASHANEIGRIKHSSGGAVYLPGREREVIEAMIAANPGPANDFRSGKVAALNFLKGQVMKLSKGKANPGVVGEILERKLKS